MKREIFMPSELKIFIFSINFRIFSIKRQGGDVMILERIKLLCEEKNISVGQLENLLEFGNGTIRKWETVSPSVHKLQKVAKFFNVSLDYLVNDETQNKAG